MTSKSLKDLLLRLVKAYPVGSCYTTNTNTNPAAWLGGTWELIDKSFAYKWFTNPFTFNTTNTQSSASFICLRGHCVEIRLTWQNKVALSDTATVIATVDVANFGLTAGQHTFYPIAWNDGCNAVGIARAAWSGTTMTMYTDDWVTRTTSYPTTTASNGGLSYTMVVQDPSSMDDDYCNQFVWRRTA